MPHFGPWELMILLAIALLIFGSTRLPKLARSMAEAARELRGAADEADAKKTS